MAITTQPIEITEELRSTLVRVGNYTHPLFSDLAVAQASGMSALPLPGQALLLLAGGAAENSGAIDDAIALVALSETAFFKPAFTGDLVTLELTELDRTLTSKGDKAIANFAWKITNQVGEILATTTAKMLMRA